jgi:CheY-like chemotaxis protein
MEGPPRVLVVDDEASLLLTLVANLELEGFEVMEARSGAQALALIEAHEFSVVLSDIRMPGLNGVELCQRIRKLRPELPVILMTAFANEHLIRDAVSDGALMVIPKPFGIEHVVRMLHAAMKRPVVLVIDDMVEVANKMAATLRQVGLPARVAYDGKAAIDAFRAGDISVCIVDLVMPGMNGAEVIDQIRALDPSAIVIAMSGLDVEELFRHAAQNADTLLRKPILPSDLLQAIANARTRVPVNRR